MPVDVERLKKEHSILDVIGSRVDLRQRGQVFWGCCPFHAENTPSFKVDPEKGFYKCFGCGAAGDQIGFLEAFEGVDFARAVEILGGHADDYDYSRVQHRPQPSAAPDQPNPDHFARLKPGLQPLAGTPGAEYLVNRGIALDLAIASGIRYHADIFGRPAVVFPLINAAGELVGMQARHIDNQNPRMHTIVRDPHATGPHGGVFATPGALKKRQIVITEGPIDALSLAMCQIPTLAVCGAANRPSWLKNLCRKIGVIGIAYDTDNAGEKNAAEICEVLGQKGVRIYRLKPKQEKRDWNDELLRLGRLQLSWHVHQIVAPLFTEKIPVRIDAKIPGMLQAAYPPEPDLPDGWARITLQNGEIDVRDMRELAAEDGTPLRYRWW